MWSDNIMNKIIWGEDKSKYPPIRKRKEDKGFLLEEDLEVDDEELQKVAEADPLLDPEDYLSNEEYEEIVGRKLE